MPELPEVETIRRELSETIVGKTIRDLEILERKQFLGNPRAVIGRKIREVGRRAKLILLRLTGGQNLICHLKLTGQLFFVPKGSQGSYVGEVGGRASKAAIPNKFTRAVFEFTDGSHLYFNDMRTFGWIRHISDQELAKLSVEEYGPEPFDPAFTKELFGEMLAKRPAMKIKPLLMDQAFLAGVGNAYSDEVLFVARLHPLRRAGTLSQAEVAKLHRAIRQVLSDAIRMHGLSLDTYRRTSGEKGTYETVRHVYRREGEPCRVCRTPIRRFKLGSRSGHLCPHCQK